MTIGDGQLIMVFHHPQLGPCLAGGDSHTLTMRGPLPAAGNGLAAAWYHGGLLLVGIAPGSSNLWWGTCQDLTFPRLIENHVLTDRATACAPALVIWHDLPVMAWRGVGQDQTIWWATFTDGAWSAQQQLTDRGTAASPALVVLHDVLYMIWRGVIDLKDGRADDDTLWYSTLDPGATPTWSPQAHMGGPNGDIQSVGSPAVAAFGPHLQIATYTAAQPSGSGGGGGSDGGSGSGGGSGSDGNGGSGGATGAPQTSDAPADAAPTLAVFDGTTVISSTTLAHTLGHDGLTAFA